MPNQLNAQTEQSINTATVSRTRRGIGKLNHADMAVTLAVIGVDAQKQAEKRPNVDTMQQSVHIQSSGSNTGIAALSFTDVQCNGDYLNDKKQAIIDTLIEAAQGARALVHLDEYHPLPKPIMWTLDSIDFGVMVDAVAVSDADILARADEIINKLCRDCDLFALECGGEVQP